MPLMRDGPGVRVRVPEYPQVSTGEGGAAPEAEVPWLAASLNLGEVAGLVVEATVPRFAEATSVFALESMLTAGEPDATAGKLTVRRLGNGMAEGGRPAAHPAFRPGDVVVFEACSPYARCVRDRAPVIFEEPGIQFLERAGYQPDALAIMSRFASFLAVPMPAGDSSAGLLLFARGPAAAPFTIAEAAQVTGLAARAGQCVASACLALSKQRMAMAPRRMVPALGPAQAAVEVTARCLPAPGQAAGGDWWDAVALPGGRTALIAGDAMGHDEHAATAMTQLRAAAYALAGLDLPPAEMLRRLDRTTTALTITPFATCVYAVIDPANGSCVVAGAGHLPPVVATPDGATTVPHLPSGLPIGLGTGIYGQITLPFAPGTILALYTDGLVDTRTRSAQQGIHALREALADRSGSLGTVCDRVLRDLAAHREDDTTLILARSQPGYNGLPPPVSL